MRCAVWRCLRQHLRSSSSQLSMSGRQGSSLDFFVLLAGILGERSSAARYLYTVSRLTPTFRAIDATVSPSLLILRISFTLDMLIISLLAS